MKDFSQIMNNSNQQGEDVNESLIIGTLLASAVLSWCATPILQPVTKSFGEGLKSFWGFLFNKKTTDSKQTTDPKKSTDPKQTTDPKKTDDPKKSTDPKKTSDPKKTDDPKKTTDPKEENKAMNSMIMIAKKANKKEKDPKKKKKNELTLDLLASSSFDENGKELPIEERAKKLKESMTDDQFKAFTKEINDTYEKNKNNEELKNTLKKAKNSITDDDYEKMMKNVKDDAKRVQARLAKEKDAMAEYEAQLKALEDQIAKKDAQTEKLKEKLEKLKNNPPQTLATELTGVKASPSKKSNDSTDDSKEGENVKKDANGNILKQEKVTDPETGKKISVTTHTGPRGGKFYYPDGKPKTAQNKVYVKESNSLSQYLLESIE